ncbi:uncharacterized protein LOC115794913 [Archocentrus centrarchus]|uniref:uncharacterized protein LOC115794913 n=1 Tax=Archocentrus centrarchus TaxID=63155 RepID=UPI0011EA46A0|nr:uncharacterized protein LOC115794913 [Archocentrus centrarchus]
MASTPSASALSAVLRCRRNIWTRNPPTKRPSASVYTLGLAGGTLRDSPAERGASNQTSAWEAVPQGESVVVMVGGRLTVSYRSDREGGKVSRENSKLRYPKLWQPPGDARSAAAAAQRERPGRLPERDAGSKIMHMIKYQRYSVHVRKTARVKDASEFPAGILKLSVTSCPCITENAGQIPSFVSTGWSALKSMCLSLTASTILFLNLSELCRSSSQGKEERSRSHGLQAHKQTSSKNSRKKGLTEGPRPQHQK